MDTHYKIMDIGRLDFLRGTMPQGLVVTNGCFDCLHAGHVDYLERARSLGKMLIVGLNGDDAVTVLKGAGRPINKETDRARVLAALECVHFVIIFQDVRATEFIRIAKPEIYVKGGDYTLETLYPPEREAVEAAGGRIVILPLSKGYSTTEMIKRIAR